MILRAATLLAAFSALSGAGQPRQPAAPASAAPVNVIVRITSADGRPVSDVNRDELTLSVNGRARAIRSLEFVPAPPPRAAQSLPAPFATNIGQFDARDGEPPFYRLSFVPDTLERTGSRYPVIVTTTRAGSVARVAPDVVIARPSLVPLVKDMVRLPGPYRDLPLRVGAIVSVPSAGADKLTLLTLIESADGAKLASAIVAVLDNANRVVTQSLEMPAADLQSLPAQINLLVAPGAYRLRVAATDATGRAGVVDQPLTVGAATAGPGRASSLVVGVPKTGAFSLRLQFTPADRAMIGYLELYDMPEGSTVSVNYELADWADDAAFATGPGHITPGIGKLICTGGFDIGALAPGDYAMRAVISVDGKVVGRVVRAIRKTS